MNENKANVAIAVVAAVGLITVTLISAQCSIRTSELDGEQASACLRGGGDWVNPPKATAYGCAVKK